MSSTSSNPFCGYFNSLSSTLNNLGQVANQVSAQLDGSLQNVALNIQEVIRDNLPNSHQDQQTSSRTTKCPTSPSSTTSSADSSPLSEEDTNLSYMGSGGLSGEINNHRDGNPSTSSAIMCCDQCGYKFNLLNRKKMCRECNSGFCSSCCPKSEGPRGTPRICKRCRVLLKRPPVRSDLMQLRVKDLQRYLMSKKVNTKSCVEKKDLVELVMRQNGAAYTASSGRVSGANSSIRDPIERQQGNIPSSYVESTHRHDWLAKLDQNEEKASSENPSSRNALSPGDDSISEDYVMVSPNDVLESSDNARYRNSCLPDEVAEEAREQTPVDMVMPPEDTTPTEQNLPTVEGELRDSGPNPHLVRSQELNIPGAQGAGAPIESDAISSSSPRKFADRGLVYLSEIQTLEELHELSAKQMKDILAVNRVNFKGVVEKEELLKILERLWKSEKKLEEERDNLDDSDLCKICMDSPVDCVMLECGHMCTCIKCGKQMNECPMCRQYVVRVVKTFKS